MSEKSPERITLLLERVGDGDGKAFDELFPLVYEELRKIANSQLRRDRPGHTLMATGLVHETYMKLIGKMSGNWQGRGHFFGVAAHAMRQVLIDHARRKGSQKRGGDWQRVTLGDDKAKVEFSREELLALDSALKRLDAMDERLHKVVEMRFFGGLSENEIAEALGVTTRTVQRLWARGRAWLHAELYPEKNAP